MQQTTKLKLTERTALGSRAAKTLRREGYVPGVVYGHKTDSQAVMAPRAEVIKAYLEAGKRHPIELELGDKKRLAMIKQVNIEPAKHKLRHVAFFVVKQNEKVQTEVPVTILGEGETPAEKAGLVLIKNVDIVEVEALPRELPDALEVSGEKLAEAGDHLTVADIKAPEGVTILSDAAQQIVSAVEPAALAAANDAAAGAATDETEVEAEHGEEEGVEESTEGETDEKPADKDAKKE